MVLPFTKQNILDYIASWEAGSIVVNSVHERAMNYFLNREGMKEALEDTELSTVVSSGENHIGKVSGQKVRVSSEFTRPADSNAYTIGDVVSNNTTTTTLITLANCARVNAGSGFVVGCRLITNLKSIIPGFRVHLFNVSSPTVSADNAANKEIYNDASKKIIDFDLPAMMTPVDTDNSDISKTQDMNLRIPFVCDSGSKNLYAYLETLAAFTPANGQKFALELIIEQD